MKARLAGVVLVMGALACNGIDSPVSIADNSGAMYCSGWDRFISSRIAT